MLKTKIRRPHREREALQAPQGIWRPFSPSPREEGLGSVVDRRRRRRRLGSTGADKHAASRRRRVGAKAMAWWDKAVAFPLKRACVAVAAAAARVKAPNPSELIRFLILLLHIKHTMWIGGPEVRIACFSMNMSSSSSSLHLWHVLSSSYGVMIAEEKKHLCTASSTELLGGC